MVDKDSPIDHLYYLCMSSEKEIVRMGKKSVVKNYLYNAFYQVFTVITPLLVTPYVSRVLGAEGVGTSGYVQSIATYFVLFGALGSSLYGQREIAYVQSDPDRRSVVFKEIIAFRIVTVLLATILYGALFCIHGQYRLIFAIYGIEVLASAFDISWFFMGIQDFRKSVMRNIIIKCASVILIFLVVRDEKDVPLYAACYAVPTLISNLSLWLYLPKYITKARPKRWITTKRLLPLLTLFVPQVATEVYTVLDKTMIGSLGTGMAEVGYYEQSQKIIKVIVKIITALGLVMLPKMSELFVQNRMDKIKEEIEGSFQFVFVFGCPMMFGIAAIAKDLVPWFFGKGYDKVAYLMVMIAPIIVIIGLSNVIGKQFLLPSMQQGIYTASVIGGASVNFVLNALLIPRFDAEGACVATVMAELSVTLIQAFGVRGQLPVLRYCLEGIKYLVIGAVMGAVVYVVGMFMQANVLTTVLQMVVGLAVYGGILVALRDPLLMKIMKKFRRKGKA